MVDYIIKHWIEEISDKIISAFKKGRKVLIIGCGGSAAQAQHFSSELLGKFEKQRQALPAIALTTDTSTITAIANDYGFEHVFSRQIEALGKKGDILITLSTSGNSTSILKAQEQALSQDMIVVPFPTNYQLKTTTAHTQEKHLSMIHAICGLVEEAF